MPYRIEVLAHNDDGRGKTIEKTLESQGVTAQVRVVDVYTSENEAITSDIFIDSVCNPVTQILLRHPERVAEGSPDNQGDSSSQAPRNDDLVFDYALEIGFLPGVTDNVGHTAEEIASLSSLRAHNVSEAIQRQEDNSGLPRQGASAPPRNDDCAVYSSRLYLISGDVTQDTIENLSAKIANKLIQNIRIKDYQSYKNDGGMGAIIPKVTLSNQGSAADDVNLDVPDEELQVIGKDGIENLDGTRRGPLGMSLLYMHAVRDYFISEGRPAKDIELEMIAQSWSEHCKHTIFASPIDEIKDGIYKHYIKRATNEIRAAKKKAYLEKHPSLRESTANEAIQSQKDNSGLPRQGASAPPRNDKQSEIDNYGDICVSVFSDNAGGIIFDEKYLITDKVETHNSPSALDPFGGSITGIVGVNRDCMGFGQGAKPVINRYGFCLAFPETNTSLRAHNVSEAIQRQEDNSGLPRQGASAPPRNDDKFNLFRDPNLTIPILPPDNIMNGVVQGVEAGGNQSGIPTPQGFVYFDDRYVGKPLVFVGTIGLIPREINGKPGHEKCAQPGDKIIMAGGRVGRDGIHGATFSSVALDEGSPATAVQIGDPITQKKMSDAIIKEIRGLGLYNAITDNGAGGLSSSVGEMAEQSGGFAVELEKVPLKYPGMAPWEIWISESQERMTLAVPPENTDELIERLAKRGVEATVIGTYTDTGRAQITWNGETIMDMTMDFLHDGIPETPLTTTFTPGGEDEPDIEEPLPSSSLRAHNASEAIQPGTENTKDGLPRQGASAPPRNDETYGDTLLHLLARPNICSKEFISTQYDHNVQGSAVLGPLQGPGRVYADASITKPVLTSPKGVVLSQGLFPRYSDIDTYHMSTAALDFAVRAAIAAGADINHLALLDNFCWCSSDEPERLGQLKRSAEAIYELAVLYGTPFISGKDSMFNDFKGFDKNGNPIKISVPPTLLVSSIGVIPHVDQSISLAPKAVGDIVYLLGETEDELGGSEYYDMLGHLGRNVPQTHGARNLMMYKLYSRAARKHLIASAMPVGLGGLGATLAKKAIAGQMGMDIDVGAIDLRPDKALFSESTGRIVVTVAPQNVKAFEKVFKKFHHLRQIGHVAYSGTLNINNILTIPIEKLCTSYKRTLQDY